jgi:hypothetical protein
MSEQKTLYDLINLDTCPSVIKFCKNRQNIIENSGKKDGHHVILVLNHFRISYIPNNKHFLIEKYYIYETLFCISIKNLDEEYPEKLKQIKYCESCMDYRDFDEHNIYYNKFCSECTKNMICYPDTDEIECSLCKDKLKGTCRVTKTDCNHFFHYKCLKQLQKPLCPLCRRNLDEDSDDE